jgi:hypothetical protein
VERGQQVVGGLQQHHPGLVDVQVGEVVDQHVLEQLVRAPAISTPVGPPPTTTTVSAPLSISLGSFSASSNWRSRWARSRSASGMLLSGKLCSSTPGIPKVAVVAPAARIR